MIYINLFIRIYDLYRYRYLYRPHLIEPAVCSEVREYDDAFRCVPVEYLSIYLSIYMYTSIYTSISIYLIKAAVCSEVREHDDAL